MATLVPQVSTSQINHKQSSESHRGRGITRGRGNVQRGGRGGSRSARPTHFLALPLQTHKQLRNRVSTFQAALFDAADTHPQRKGAISTSLVEGVDSSIVIDPWRLHMTLGVMALEPEAEETANTDILPAPPGQAEDPPDLESSTLSLSLSEIPPSSRNSTMNTNITRTHDKSALTTPFAGPRKTVSTALALLRSLQPAISNILRGEMGVQVPITALDVMKTIPMRLPTSYSVPANASNDETSTEAKQEKVGAEVLFVGPGRGADETRQRLRDICDLIHGTFKRAGYITETRPLKLHCTILNTSHRRLTRGIPFAYSDLLASGACRLLGAAEEDDALASPVSSINVALAASTQPPKYRSPLAAPPPLDIDLGTYTVDEVQLWVMGSHGPRNQYVSCGGVRLE